MRSWLGSCRRCACVPVSRRRSFAAGRKPRVKCERGASSSSTTRTRRRVVLGHDAAGTQKISKATGLVLYDEKGNERGGFATMADGSVVIGMDAPVGLGAPVRDRIGLKVFPNGSAYVMLIDNESHALARRVSEEGGTGARGVQVFKWAPDGSKYDARTITAHGDTRNTVSR